VHRIGRTARAGSTGTAISFACERFCFGLPDIEAYIKRSIPVEGIPETALNIGKPTHPEATAEGLKSEDRAAQHTKKPNNSGKPQRRRR